MTSNEELEIPETGAIFTFGKSKFADNEPSKFWIKKDRIVDIACGDEHTAVLTDSGRLFTFGNNDWGQLGLGHRNPVIKPSCVKSLKPDKVLLVACGKAHTLVFQASGRLSAFGSNSDGQLGVGKVPEGTYSPMEIEAKSIHGKHIKALAAGTYHSMALTESNEVFVWGGNTEGQLGLGSESEETVAVPTRLDLGPSISIVKISCGYYHSALLTSHGDLFTFGESDGGRLGLTEVEEQEVDVPRKVNIDEEITDVSCGGIHTVAVSASGRLFSFGLSSNGQLGLGTSRLESYSPSPISSLWDAGLKAKTVSCGENHTAVVTDCNRLVTFGDGRHGKLCLDSATLTNQFKPALSTKFKGFRVCKAVCGGCHTMVFAQPIPELETSTNGQDGNSEQNGLLNNSDLIEDKILANGFLDASINISARKRHREEVMKAESSGFHGGNKLPPLKNPRSPREEDPEAIINAGSELITVNGNEDNEEEKNENINDPEENEDSTDKEDENGQQSDDNYSKNNVNEDEITNGDHEDNNEETKKNSDNPPGEEEKSQSKFSSFFGLRGKKKEPESKTNQRISDKSEENETKGASSKRVTFKQRSITSLDQSQDGNDNSNDGSEKNDVEERDAENGKSEKEPKKTHERRESTKNSKKNSRIFSRACAIL